MLALKLGSRGDSRGDLITEPMIKALSGCHVGVVCQQRPNILIALARASHVGRRQAVAQLVKHVSHFAHFSGVAIDDVQRVVNHHERVLRHDDFAANHRQVTACTGRDAHHLDGDVFARCRHGIEHCKRVKHRTTGGVQLKHDIVFSDLTKRCDEVFGRDAPHSNLIKDGNRRRISRCGGFHVVPSFTHHNSFTIV